MSDNDGAPLFHKEEYFNDGGGYEEDSVEIDGNDEPQDYHPLSTDGMMQLITTKGGKMLLKWSSFLIFLILKTFWMKMYLCIRAEEEKRQNTTCLPLIFSGGIMKGGGY